MKTFIKIMLYTVGLLLVVAITTAIGLTALHLSGSAAHIHAFLQNKWWVFAIWRYSLLAVLLWQWPRICRWFGKKKQLSDEAIQGLIKRRWLVLVFIVLFEIVVVYGV